MLYFLFVGCVEGLQKLTSWPAFWKEICFYIWGRNSYLSMTLTYFKRKHLVVQEE